MVALLVLIFITINIGDVATKTTTIANAADTAALQLGTQLSTIANTYKEALGSDLEDCVKVGICSIALGVIAAIIVTVIICYFAPPLIPYLPFIDAAVAGATTGVSAYARGIRGKELWNQVIFSAQIGATIGSVGQGISRYQTMPKGTDTKIAAENGPEKLSIIPTENTTTVEIYDYAGILVEEPPLQMGQVNDMTIPERGVALVQGGAQIKTGGKITQLAAEPPSEVKLPTNIITKTVGKIKSASAEVLQWANSQISNMLTKIGIKPGMIRLPSLTPEMAQTIGSAANMALTAGSGLYRASKVQDSLSQAMRQYARQISGLGNNESIKESIFLSALSQVVDDPQKTDANFSSACNGQQNDLNGDGIITEDEKDKGGDPCDSDGDGDIKESVSYFQILWDRRLRALKAATDEDFEFVEDFWDDDLSNFKDYLNSDNKAIDDLSDGGEIMSFLSALENAGYDVPFWQPGPTQEELNNWYNDTEDTYPEDYLKTCGYDEVDYAADKFNDFVNTVTTLEKEGLQKRWEYWLGWFYEDQFQEGYNAEEDNSSYAIFNRIVNGDSGKDFLGIDNWIGAINNVESNLGECQIDDEGNIINAPCRHSTSDQPDYYATTDSDSDDEFVTARSQLQDIKSKVLAFNDVLISLNNRIEDEMVQAVDLEIGSTKLRGTNPIHYSWNDSLGSHEVTVTISESFRVPTTKSVERGTKWWSGEECTVLRKYKDETGENTWVSIKRRDPDSRPVGILGFWNSGGVIERTAHAAYSYDYVKLVK